MPGKVNVDDLVSAQEIADRFDVSKPRVHQWHAEADDFPAPIAKLGEPADSNYRKRAGIYVWDWRKVKGWGLKTGRLVRDPSSPLGVAPAPPLKGGRPRKQH